MVSSIDFFIWTKRDPTYLKDVGKLVFGKLDTVADSLSDGSKDLFNLVLRLDVVDWQARQFVLT